VSAVVTSETFASTFDTCSGLDAAALTRDGSRSAGTQEGWIEELVSGFSEWVFAFEAAAIFPGPSLYFHERAIARRRQHETVRSLLGDTCFLEYSYAVLPAWGMHRLGSVRAKVGDFAQITDALREKATALEALWPLQITELDADDAQHAAAIAWDVIAHIRVSTSQTQIVAGSKFLHHALPDLIPPIDGRYTSVFFNGYRPVAMNRATFLDWFPKLAAIGARCSKPIRDAIARGGYMATGEAKVIDNAIIGFIQSRGGDD